MAKERAGAMTAVAGVSNPSTPFLMSFAPYLATVWEIAAPIARDPPVTGATRA